MAKYADPIKVCFATWQYPPDKGGVGRSAQRIATYLVESGFEVHVFVPDTSTPFSDDIPTPVIENGIHLYRVPTGASVSGKEQAMFLTIKHYDDLISFDIFHGFFLPIAYPCILVAGRTKRPVIASIRGVDGFGLLANLDYFPYISAAVERASWITSVNSALLDNVSAISDIENRSSFIPNSIDATTFPKWKPKSENSGTIGTVAIFRSKKNLPLLISAYAKIDPKFRRRLLLVGEFAEYSNPEKANAIDTERAKITALIKKHALNCEVDITGFLDKAGVQAQLLNMNVYVQCSKYEGLPNALLEAAAVGLPIVSTATDGMKDVLVDGESALLVPPDDPNRLAQAIEMILMDDTLAQKLSEGALKLSEQLSPEYERDLWIQLYYRLLEIK